MSSKRSGDICTWIIRAIYMSCAIYNRFFSLQKCFFHGFVNVRYGLRAWALETSREQNTAREQCQSSCLVGGSQRNRNKVEQGTDAESYLEQNQPHHSMESPLGRSGNKLFLLDHIQMSGQDGEECRCCKYSVHQLHRGGIFKKISPPQV